MRCIKCEKELIPVFSESPYQPANAGELICTFHYGSRFDQMLDWNGPTETASPNRADKLTECKQIRTYICDDCFERHSELFDGYEIEVKRTERKVL